MNRLRVGILVTSVLVLLPTVLRGSDPASAPAGLKPGHERFVAESGRVSVAEPAATRANTAPPARHR